MSERVIYLVRSWPRLSQTFIINEVLALERRGLRLNIFSLVRSGEQVVQPQVSGVLAPVAYLEDARRDAHARAHLTVLCAAPTRYLGALVLCLRRPNLAAGYGECTALDCFFHAVQVAASVERMRAAGDPATHVHAHFAHDPALVGMLLSRLTGLPFSFTAHARDLLQIPVRSLVARARAATALVTCCVANADYISSVVPANVRPPVRVVHHGVELGRFLPTPRDPYARATRLLSVGRLVEKKGYADLLHALKLVAFTGVPFTCRIYGDGPLRTPLTTLRNALGLREQVEFMGAASGEQIADELAGTDVFVLTPRVTEDGDRDGIPNVLVEAMACGLPVVTTSAGGITELVEDEVNGLVAEPGAVDAVAEKIGRLLANPQLRGRLSVAARATAESDYDVDLAARALEDVFCARAHRRPAIDRPVGARR